MITDPSSLHPADDSWGKRLWRRQRNLLTALLLMVVSWCLYFPTLRHEFVYYDDVRILRDHPELYGGAKFSDSLRGIFVTGFPREEPLLLRDVSWAIDSRIFGFGNPLGYHLNNILLHGIVVALMFSFLIGTTRRYGFALAVSAAYLVVAVHTDSIAWIMGRKDILSTLFMLLALCAQTRRLAAKTISARTAWYLTTLVCFVCGLFSKISVLTFPVVLFLHAILLPYLNGQRAPNSRLLERRIWFKEVILVAPALLVTALVYRWYAHLLAQMGILDRGYTAHGLSHLWNLLMVDPLVFWLYVKQIFLPWHLRLFYTWPMVQSIYEPEQIIISLATVGVLAVSGVWLFLRRKDLFFYFATFFVLMVPYLNLMYIGIWVAERYVFFSVFCVLAIAVSLAIKLWHSPWPGVRVAVLIANIGFLGINVIQTTLYQQVWRNAETLWQYHLTLPEPDTAAYANLAVFYYADATAHEGTPQMEISLHKMSVVVDAGFAQFWPDHQQPPPEKMYFFFFLQSIVQEVKGDLNGALASLLQADELHPQFDSTLLNLARLYHKLAAAASNVEQRRTYATAAVERFNDYIKIEFHGQSAPLEVQQELADLKADSALNQPAKPAP